MNKNKTPTQLMIAAASLHNEREPPAPKEHRIDELARLVAESLAAQVPAGMERELSVWLTTSEGAQALRESWQRAVERYLALRSMDASVNR